MVWGNRLSSSGKLFFFLPLLLKNYRQEEIALWFVLASANSLLLVYDFGFSSTLSRLNSYIYSGLKEIPVNGRMDEKSLIKSDVINRSLFGRVRSTSIFIYGALFFFTILTLGIILYFPVSKTRAFSDGILYIILFIYTVSFGFLLLAKRSEAILMGFRHVALVNRVNMWMNLISALILVVLAYFQVNFLYIISALICFSFFIWMRNIYLEKRYILVEFPELALRKFDRSVMKWLWRPAWRSGIGIITSTGSLHLIGLLYAGIDGLNATPYLMTLKLMTIIVVLSQAPFYSLIPTFSGLRAEGDIDKLIVTSGNAMNKSLSLLVIGFALLLILGPIALSFINSSVELMNSKFILVYFVVFFLERHHAMHAQIYSTTNHIPFYKWMVLSSLINLALIYLTYNTLGIWSIVCAHLVSNLLTNNWINPRISVNSMGVQFAPYFFKYISRPFFAGVILLITILLFDKI